MLSISTFGFDPFIIKFPHIFVCSTIPFQKRVEKDLHFYTMAALPTRFFAGVQVPDTPLITKALTLCRRHLSDFAYNHSVRSWLFGFLIAARIPELQGRDLEAHAIAAILHDLGWDQTGNVVTAEKRFEVDGANAARNFLKREAGDWDKHRIQLVWDAIALHTTTSIAVSGFHSPTILITCLIPSHLTRIGSRQTPATASRLDSSLKGLC